MENRVIINTHHIFFQKFYKTNFLKCLSNNDEGVFYFKHYCKSLSFVYIFIFYEDDTKFLVDTRFNCKEQ